MAGRGRPLSRALLAGAAGLLWIVAAGLLWRSAVPDGLDPPNVDAASLVPASHLDRAERYERFLRVEFVVAQVVLVLVLLVYARHGARFARESAAGRIGTGMLLGMLGLGLVWFSQVPFRLVEVWWQRRYDQTELGYIESLFEDWLALGAAFLFISLALAIVMAIAGRFPRGWWVGAAPVFVALAALFAFIAPFLYTTRDADPELRADARRFAAEQGLEPIRVAVEEVSSYTQSPNAYAAGYGPTKRVVFWDTLLDGRFSDGEVRVVLAHELAHHSRGHILEGLGWYALFALPGTWLIALATRRRGGMREAETIPLGLLVLVVLQLASLPLQSAISRHMEEEADWVALRTTEDPRSARALFRHFSTEGLVDPDPPAWSRLLFDSHPSIVDRVGLVEAWRARNR